MKRHSILIFFCVTILLAAVVSSCAASKEERLLIYEDEEVIYFVKEAVTDGYHILVRVQIEEKTPVINWDHIAGICKVNIVSEEPSYRSTLMLEPYSRVKNPEDKTYDIYFTAFTTSPFESIQLVDFWLDSRHIPDGLELFPEWIGTEFIVPSAQEQKAEDFYATKFTISRLGFHCDIRLLKNWENGSMPDMEKMPVQLHYADGSIAEVIAERRANGLPDLTSHFIAAHFEGVADADWADYENIVKVMIDNIECVKP